MAALPYMQLYIADYLADTAHLSTEEHGAYMLLMFNYWQTGKPLPKSRLHRIARISSDRWPEIESVLSEFFEDDGGRWIHLRIERDIEAVHTAPRGKKLPGGESLSGYKGYVYFVTDDISDRVKIGYSKNPWARLAELRRSHGEQLRVVATIKTVDHSEANVHKALAKFRVEGEWFRKDSCIEGLISSIVAGKVTTVAAVADYATNYGSSATATTNTDTDTDKEHNSLSLAYEPESDHRAEAEVRGDGPFAMHLEWEPNPKRLDAYAYRAGIPLAAFSPTAISGFVLHHDAKGEAKTEAEWVSSLVNWIKRDVANAAAAESRTSNVRKLPVRNAVDDDDFNATGWLQGGE